MRLKKGLLIAVVLVLVFLVLLFFLCPSCGQSIKQVFGELFGIKTDKSGLSSVDVVFSVYPENAGVIFSDASSYKLGDKVNLTAVPNVGYKFDYWRNGDVASTSPIFSTIVDADKSITANFKKDKKILSTNLNIPDSGEIILSPEGGSYDEGVSVEVKASSTPGYVFLGWGGSIAGAENPKFLVMDSDKSVTAIFNKVYNIFVAASPEGSGTASLNSGTFLSGTKIVLRAYPSEGYIFSNWSGAVSGKENPISLMVDSDKSVTANFTKQNK